MFVTVESALDYYKCIGGLQVHWTNQANVKKYYTNLYNAKEGKILLYQLSLFGSDEMKEKYLPPGYVPIQHPKAEIYFPEEPPKQWKGRIINA